MTWIKLAHDDRFGVDHVGCNNGGSIEIGPSCNAYNGDTLCKTELPLLCIKKGQADRPGYTAYNPTLNEFYDGWTGGHISITKSVRGDSLTTKERADFFCSFSFGSGWRLAEFHDGNGGWGFAAFGNLPFNQSFWVGINNQPANCWLIN